VTKINAAGDQFSSAETSKGVLWGLKSLFAIWLLGQKTVLFCHFFTFFQLRSTTMRLQKAKKLTKNSSLLPQTPNRKQALTVFFTKISDT
jgi:hypothetical protein